MSNPHNPVGWFEIYVQDMPRAKAFYEKVFGEKLEQIDTPALEMWAFPKKEGMGCTGALCQMEGKDSGIGGTIIYFMCEDCAVETARVTESGGRVQREKFSIGQYGHIALVLDTEGNLIGLHSMN